MLKEKFENVVIDDLISYSDSINQPNNQEIILLHVREMKYEWQDYADFDEGKTALGRTLIVPLPTADFNCITQLKELCDTLTNTSIGAERDYEYVIRWNQSEAIFHLLFSERMINYSRLPKIYTRDFWYDKKTNRQTKPEAKNAELRFEEGTFQRDKDGKIKYEGPVFLERDNFFDSEEWIKKFNQTIQQLFEEFLEVKEQSVLLDEGVETESINEMVELEIPLKLNQPSANNQNLEIAQKAKSKKEFTKNMFGKIDNLKIPEKTTSFFSVVGSVFKKVGLRIGFVFKILGSGIKRFFEKTGLLEKLTDFIS